MVAERRRSDPFFRQAFDFLAKVTPEKLKDAQFATSLSRLNTSMALVLRAAQLLAQVEDSFADVVSKRSARATQQEHMEGLVKEILSLETKLRTEHAFQRSAGGAKKVGLALSDARIRCEDFLHSLGRDSAKERQTSESKKTKAPPGDEEFHGGFKVGDDFFQNDDPGWKEKIRQREDKRKRKEERAELLRDLQEKLSAMAQEAVRQRSKESTDTVEDDALALFERAQKRCKGLARRSEAWALAFLGVDASTPFVKMRALYYERAKLWHPDKQGAQAHLYKEAMIWLNDAWKILRSNFK